MMKGKLGKLRPKLDVRTLKLGSYYTTEPSPPPTSDWQGHLPAELGMLGNDTVGDCTCAAVGHAVQTWSSTLKTRVDLVTDDVLAAYGAITGYDGSPATDTGAYCLDVLNYWRKNPIGGITLDAFAKVNQMSGNLTRAAINEFGGLYVGVGLPTSIEDQVVWDVGTAPWSAGGHCVFVTGYDPDGVTCITWGTLQRMTWAFWNMYVDEAYALFDLEMWTKDGTSGSGFAVADLKADLARLG